MAEGSLYNLLVSGSKSSPCPTCNDHKTNLLKRYIRLLTGSSFCGDYCRTSAERVCEVLEQALNSPLPIETAVSRLEKLNPPLHIIQSLVDKRPDKRLKRILLKLAGKSDSIPTTLFLTGVTCASTSEYTCGGGYADIFMGKYRNQPVALKRLRVHQTVALSRREKVKKDFYREALIWRNLNHQHILPFLGIDSSLFNQSPCMVSPWMSAGNIRDVICRMKDDGISDKTRLIQFLKWCVEISLGLEYLHREEVVHGDLRGPNILIDNDNHARIADFGLAVFAEGASREYNSARGGNEHWLAPEVMFPEAFGLSSIRPTCASDIYSFACLCLEVFTGSDPFEGISFAKLLIDVPKGLRPPRPDIIDGVRMPNSVWELLCMCWEHQPSDRPDVQAVVKYTNTRFLRIQEPWETTEASGYLNRVFELCDGRQSVYEGASLLLKSLLRGRFRTAPEVAIQHAVNYLSGLPQLIEELKPFLPTGLTFQLSDDFDRLRLITVDKLGADRTFRASFGLIKVEDCDPEFSNMDEHILYFLNSALANENYVDAIMTLQEGDARRASHVMKRLADEGDYWQQFLETYSRSSEDQHMMRHQVRRLSSRLMHEIDPQMGKEPVVPRLGKKKALLIGISYYSRPAIDDFGRLDGPQRDARQFERLLIDFYGYKKEDIVVMTDEPNEMVNKMLNPTRVNILREIKHLVEDAQPGDSFVFLYAGHAGQVLNLDGTEEDGYDEVLLPVDHEGLDSGREDKLILDNELRRLLVDSLPVGARLTAIFSTSSSRTALDLDHYACNTVYMPWVSKAKRGIGSPRMHEGDPETLGTIHEDISHREDIAHELSSDTSQTASPATSRRSTWTPKTRSIHSQHSVSDKVEADTTEWIGNLVDADPAFNTDNEPGLEHLLDSPRTSHVHSERCNGFCSYDDSSAVEKPNVISLSVCMDEQVVWEDYEGNSMTQTLIEVLRKSPHPSIRKLMADISLARHKTGLELHKWRLEKFEKEREKDMQDESTVVVQGSDLELDPSEETTTEDKGKKKAGKYFEQSPFLEFNDFEAPQLGSQNPLNMDDTFVL